MRKKLLTSNPTYISLQGLFGPNNCFGVPKYQRDFAWKKREIAHFSGDIRRLFRARLQGKNEEHFFGTLVTVEEQIQGAGRHYFKLIDGQQRMICFNIFIRLIVSYCKALKGEAVDKDQPETEKILSNRISQLTQQYLTFDDEVHREIKAVSRLCLASEDLKFYYDLIESLYAKTSRASHECLQYAWNHLNRFIRKEIDAPTLDEKVDNLQHLKELLEDCTFIHIVAARPSHAYHLFCTINYRGSPLSTGDLLRAATLELLDKDHLHEMQVRAAEEWDEILRDKDYTDRYLKWYFSGKTGGGLPEHSKFDNFFGRFFSVDEDAVDINEIQAGKILGEIKKLREAVIVCRKIRKGEWPFDRPQAKEWDRNRLRLLILVLGHTNCMPLLLSAAISLSEKRFSTLVQLLEVFAFRYRIICRQHIGKATAVYWREAHRIWEGVPGVNAIRNRFMGLINQYAPESVFKANICTLRYVEKGNAALRYLLMKLEEYWDWYSSGAEGKPKVDKARILDALTITIEHIYPQKCPDHQRDDSIEEIKHTIGNLTVLGPDDNKTASTKPWSEKRIVLSKSAYSRNRSISKETKWNKDVVERNIDQIGKMACRIFSF